ncbi:MAG: alpha/beta fold hydrolase [Candidatus Tectomicrobia bacterium]|nr:alpha/beta fold hydrolase [Candidatus Tectomicrobia bacterium]
MAPNYVISARAVEKGVFAPEPGPPLLLAVPRGKDFEPRHAVEKREDWLQGVRDLADGQADGRVSEAGDVLVFVHGYNNSIGEIRRRHEILQAGLAREGWKGLVVSFDWPSDTSTLNYLEDREDAADTAKYLITDGIGLIITGQAAGCQTNVHLLGHSTGAYVIMEAFAAAEKVGRFYKRDWRIGQVGFIGGDVSAASLDADSQWGEPMFKRIMRLTNYQNGFDDVLAVSNAKRLGASPRAGRVGLTPNAHPKAVNVDCSGYFSTVDPGKQKNKVGWWAHSWHIGNRVFARDLAMTLEGRIDRNYVPTREVRDGRLRLRAGSRPRFEEQWLDHARGETG